MRRGSAGGPTLRAAGQQRTGGEPAAALNVAHVLVQDRFRMSSALG
jgi:hypothetical protein